VKRGKVTEAQQRLPRNWVYATRVLGGTIAGNPPLLDQFTVGGANTLRGYIENRYSGNNMVLWNNELRIPINDSLQAVTFIDIGDAWGLKYPVIAGDDSLRLHLGYGVGVRVQTPIGPLRLDYGWGQGSSNQFSFGIGSTF